MSDWINASNIAIVGGGRKCKVLLELLLSEDSDLKTPDIIGVADKNIQAVGIRYAEAHGIFTTTDYRELFSLKDLDLVIELTNDDNLGAILQNAKPPLVRLADHNEARSIIDYFKITAKKNELVKKVRGDSVDPEIFEGLFEVFYDFVLALNEERDANFEAIRKKLVANEWVMSQIVQGTTIPTFVIDKEHVVTHWNTACERLTGYSANDIVGTTHSWKPFRSEARPTMADLILDGIEEEELWHYYHTRWKNSELIEGAFEAEEFFPHLGQEGLWLFFTAAPIKAPDGTTVAAIETLWDRTKEKQAEAERESKNRELARKVADLTASERAMAQIVEGSTIPTFVVDKDHTVTHWNHAMEQLTGYSTREIVGTKKQWIPFYEKERPSMADVIVDQIDELEIRKLYGTKWRKSVLIEGAYEAEMFFPNLGENGKWCWFTAAPIKTPDGEVVAAIETIWDKTEDRKVEKERERHTRELAAYCSIYATLSGPLSLEGRIKEAIQEVANIFLIDGICIYILKIDGRFHLQYNYGHSENFCYRCRVAGDESMILRVAKSGKVAVFQDVADTSEDEMIMLKQESLRSLVYIPILDKRRRPSASSERLAKIGGILAPMKHAH